MGAPVSGTITVDPVRVEAWHSLWQRDCSGRWGATGGHDGFGHRLYRPTEPVRPVTLPSEPHSASVIRDLEVFINGRVLSAPPKEIP